MGCDTKVETSFPPPSDSNEVQGAEGDEGDDPADGHPRRGHRVSPCPFEGFIDPGRLAHRALEATAWLLRNRREQARVAATSHPLNDGHGVKHQRRCVEGSDEQVGNHHGIGHHPHGERREDLVGNLQRQECDDGRFQWPEQKEHRGCNKAEVNGQQNASRRSDLTPPGHRETTAHQEQNRHGDQDNEVENQRGNQHPASLGAPMPRRGQRMFRLIQRICNRALAKNSVMKASQTSDSSPKIATPAKTTFTPVQIRTRGSFLGGGAVTASVAALPQVRTEPTRPKGQGQKEAETRRLLPRRCHYRGTGL